MNTASLQRRMVFTLAALALLLSACGGPSVDMASFQPGPCEQGTTPLIVDQSASGRIAGGTYPNNCTVYCLWVPDDGSRLKIEISDFDVDLDMYIDQDLDILQYDDFGQWYSNDSGSGNESVSISDPGGRYYIQVCSYEGTPSTFTIENDYR